MINRRFIDIAPNASAAATVTLRHQQHNLTVRQTALISVAAAG